MLVIDRKKGGLIMADTYSVSLSELVREFDLQVEYAASDYDAIRLTVADVSRPGLQLAGFFDHFEPMRLQIMGTVFHITHAFANHG
jgi:serine kinase of HPr protein (carbohydrate metabolism regulator)